MRCDADVGISAEAKVSSSSHTSLKTDDVTAAVVEQCYCGAVETVAYLHMHTMHTLHSMHANA